MKRRFFISRGPRTTEMSAAGLSSAAKDVEAARRAGSTKESVNYLAVKYGIKACSSFHAESPEVKQRYPKLGFLWGLGQAIFPYDTMRFVFLNVVPLLSVV